MFATEELPACIKSWLETNIVLQQDASAESLFASIFWAVSLATFGRTKASLEALVLWSRKYIQALSWIKSAVNNANEAITDHLLLTVTMLGFYEHAVSNYNTKYFLAESFRNLNGAMTILHLRKRQGQTFTLLDKLVRHITIKQAVLHAVALPEWIWDGAEFGEEGVRLGLGACIVRFALMRNYVQDIWHNAKAMQPSSLQFELRKVIA